MGAEKTVCGGLDCATGAEDVYANVGGGYSEEFVCLCRGFMAQSTQWGHVERGQFT